MHMLIGVLAQVRLKNKYDFFVPNESDFWYKIYSIYMSVPNGTKMNIHVNG